jgi:hypothetical protein
MNQCTLIEYKRSKGSYGNVVLHTNKWKVLAISSKTLADYVSNVDF